jgi:hypothetical protein
MSNRHPAILHLSPSANQTNREGAKDAKENAKNNSFNILFAASFAPIAPSRSNFCFLKGSDRGAI